MYNIPRLSWTIDSFDSNAVQSTTGRCVKVYWGGLFNLSLAIPGETVPEILNIVVMQDFSLRGKNRHSLEVGRLSVIALYCHSAVYQAKRIIMYSGFSLSQTMCGVI